MAAAWAPLPSNGLTLQESVSMHIRCSRVPGSLRVSSDDDSEVTLLDYGAGNVRSVRNAIHLMGFRIKDVSGPKDIEQARRLIFPGVGSFTSAVDALRKKGLIEPLRDYIKTDRPFLGICLGLQLLFEYGEESGFAEGLGIIPGGIRRFDESSQLKVPHIGWNALHIKQTPTILDDARGRHVYFVHSYRATESNENKDWVLATSTYGGEFISAIKKGNIHATQFHPEKSGVVGLNIVRKFLGGGRSEAAEVAVSAENNFKQIASTLAKRVIACLDVRTNDSGDLVVTKGDQYDVRDQTETREVRNLGKPVELASCYYKDGADEVTFLNITGFRDFPLGDLPMLEVLRRASEKVFVPLTVGGGIRDFTDKDGRYYSSLEVAAEYFRSGADKISIGSDAVFAAEEYIKTGRDEYCVQKKTGMSSLEQISYVYGNQAVVVSIDPRRVYVRDPSDVPYKTVEVAHPGPNGEKYAWYKCTVNGGREGRPIGAYELAKAVEELGAGEILLNCIDCDGQGQGFDLELIKLISESVNIPVIASSGAGKETHFFDVFSTTPASAALAAGIFHRKEVPISSVKKHLVETGIETRL